MITKSKFVIHCSEAVGNTFTIRRSRLLAKQRMWQGHALACALGWHDGHSERCHVMTRGCADILHTPQEEWV
jgi:hypothetical protein